MDCLKRAIKIADICMTQGKNLYLFAHILNKFLYFYSIDAEFVSLKHNNLINTLQISADDVNNLIDLIKEHIDQAQSDDQMKEALKYLKNTKEAIRARQNDQTPKYKALNISLI